jgi:methyltransferase (TIGR00027 family)
MALPDLSNSMYVARLRYIQTVHELPERRNPDTLVRHFIPALLRLRTAWMGKQELSRLRSDPFYYYLVARTRYYDQVVSDAIAGGLERIVGVGCGSDTRAYRFQDRLRDQGIKVLECDQAESINEKQRMTKQWRHFGHVEHLGIDLNDGAWPKLEAWLGDNKPKTLVLMEGVSPYVNNREMTQFLSLLAGRLAPGSPVAYDFKISGVKDDFGRAGRTEIPYRLSTAKEEVAAFHAGLGLRLDHMELSSALVRRLLPDLNGSASIFEEDGLLRLHVTEA